MEAEKLAELLLINGSRMLGGVVFEKSEWLVAPLGDEQEVRCTSLTEHGLYGMDM